MAHILIGLGGTGGNILKAFRQRLWTDYTEEQRRSLPIGFIYVDSDKAMLDPTDVTYETIHGNCCFTASDYVDIKEHSNVDEIFGNSNAYHRLQGILGNVAETQAAVSPVGTAADQKRRAGRILFAANIDAYLAQLNKIVEKVKAREVNGDLYIYVFAGLAGGTGSGSIIDTIAQTRKWLFKNGFDEKRTFLTAYCQIPENSPKPNWNTGRYKANGYAALLELNNMFASLRNQQWGDLSLTPPFDVTSDVDYGRLYLTYENPTPDNVRKGLIPQHVKIAGGLILYSNKNDFGYTVTEPVELANLVADFVYSWIFTPGGDVKRSFGRNVTFENLANNRYEYDETVDVGLVAEQSAYAVSVRSRAIGSFGIKRIVVPESSLQEHIAYTLGIGALNNLKYSNWSAQTGYRDTPLSFDPITYIRDEGRRNSWGLTKEHLLLQKFILEGDQKEKWKEGSFRLYWEPGVAAWEKVARNANNKFQKLIELCSAGYNSGFRGRGVEEFFRDKADSVNDGYSKEIATRIEKYLFGEWASGKLSLVSLEDITSKLIVQLHRDAVDMTEQLIPALENKIKETEAAIQGVVNDYNNSGILVRPVIFNNRFARAIELCKTLYTQKTELAAMRLFAQPLYQAIEKRINDLHNRVISFIEKTDEVIKFSKERMSTLADISTLQEGQQMDGTENMSKPVIEFYNRQRMKLLEEKLYCDREKMNNISEAIRTAFVDALESDGQFLNVQRMNQKVISKTLLGTVYSQIQSYHDKICVEPQDRVLGMPVLNRLYQKYGSNPEALRGFAQAVITASGYFIDIDMNQINQNLPNTEPPRVGTNILIKRILVNLPHTEDPDLLAFADDLRQALLDQIPGGTSVGLAVDMNNPNQNEISVLMLVNGYPMRAISSVQMLKAEYDRLIAEDPKNKILLLTEGRDGDFHSIYAQAAKTPADIRDEKVPQLIVLFGLEKFVRDEASEEYGIGEKDFFGNTVVTPWGNQKLTELVYDDRTMREKGTTISKMFNEAIEELFEDVDKSVRSLVDAKKEETQNTIKAQIGAVIKNEAPARPVYNDFVKWTERAVKLVLDYKPKV